MPYGFHNRILRVNLSNQQISVEQPGEHFLRTYFGGWGLIAYYLLKEIEPGTDPLGPGNVLIFANGPVTGTPVPGSGRNAVGAKSPLTGGFGEADVGGFWGAELKRTGWDAIVITGQAEEPVYLWIEGNRVEIRDGAHLWGKKTAEVEEILKEELGDKRVRVTQCGLAGENLVRYACVINDLHHAAGRTGMGAVMGSKKLRAIAVRGTNRVELADRKQVLQVIGPIRDELKQATRFQKYGTSGAVPRINEEGALPARNFQEGTFEGAEKISGQTMAETILVDRGTCFACPLTCKRKVKVTGHYEVDPTYGGPEYEALASLGSCCGIDDLEAIVYANQLCNAYGMDVISTGLTIAWTMECFERGLLTKDDTDGLELRFGNAKAMTTLVEQIAHRQGFGDLLAEGSLRAAKRIGRGTKRYAMQVKGQEIPPSYDARTRFALGLGYATSPTGADHMHNIRDHYYASERGVQWVRPLGILEPVPADYLGPEKVRLAKYHIDWAVFGNCLGLCMFMPYEEKHLIRDIVQGVTGWNSSIFELMKVGERALAMARAFNYREGFTAKDDVAHWRFFTPLKSGPNEGMKIPAEDMAKALDLYYEMRGWDRETGAPTAGKLHELGIGWLAELLYGGGDRSAGEG
jgi:aldehyde:ferredoxin oxidoreductase